jgi:ribose/xylose/arabinose/galactoside ABC-type transport system permease subunit
MAAYKREISIAATYFLLLAVLAVFAPRFYQGDKLLNILVASAPILVAAVGMTLVILSRNIDISIGSQLSICGVVAGLLAKSGLPMPIVALLTMVAGAMMGALNGVFVALLGLPSIVVTLATMVVFREALRWWRQGESVKNLPPDFQWFGLGQEAGQWCILGIALLTFLVFAWGLRYLAAGRSVYATGSDPDAAWLVGVRPGRVVFYVLVTMGALTGLAALLNSVRFAQVDPLAGTNLELQVIAAVVVGGVAIAGGRGTLLGVLFGVALLGTVGPALVFLGAQAYWDKALQGAIILVAVASDAFSFKRRKHASAALAVE